MMTKMKCCKECPEYDLCEDKKKCCDMCDFYNTKTRKCAYIKKRKKDDKGVIRKKKLGEEDEEDTVSLNDEEEETPQNELNELEGEESERDPYGNDDMDDFFNT
ncbi:MAG: hypothetical protein V1703_01680 [Candidatus Altiarchaeota archaeon]